MNNLPKGFTYITLEELQKYNITVDLRYNTEFNFVGEKIHGYNADLVILTNEAKKALFKASELFSEKGYDLVIYDTYRPTKAVAHFGEWTLRENIDQNMKQYFFPHTNHADSFELGYLARQSGHSRGSTIDLSIIEHEKNIHDIKFETRTLLDGRKFTFLNDGTVDMGSHFDLFDEASHSYSNLINEENLANRKFFIETMEEAGFVNYEKEWWHFTLKNEPFPNQYFDFDIALQSQESPELFQ